MYGERIRERREELGFSQLDLAVLLSTSLQDIELWEEESESPTIEQLISLSEELGVTTDWLVGLEDNFDEDDEDLDDLDVEIETANFLQDIIVPHMNAYKEENEGSVYVHLQLSEDDECEDCVIYAGAAADVLSAVNVLVESLSDETGTNYYDVVAMMATAHAKMELELGDE